MSGLTIATAIFVLAGQAAAQEFRASISGKVTDSTGATIAGAEVVVTSVERSTPFRTLSNASGRYVLEFLPPGRYSLTAEKPGCKKVVRDRLTLEAADHLSLDLVLQLGDVTQSVTVTGEAPLLETETASRSGTIENRVLENVPTNGRNLFSLQYTLP